MRDRPSKVLEVIGLLKLRKFLRQFMPFIPYWRKALPLLLDVNFL